MKKSPAQPSKICVECGGRFRPKRKTQKYCSDGCRAAYYKKHYFGVTEATKTCPNCGEMFPTTKPTRQTYCTPKCRKDAARKRAEGVVASYEAERITYLGERYSALERDGFKCTSCGRGVADGVALDVESDGKGGLKTICTECKTGKERRQQ